MDVNNTKFHLLLGKDDWANCSENARALHDIWAQNEILSSPEIAAQSSFYWNHETDRLTLQPQLFRFVAAKSDSSPSLDDRRGAARDRFGNWFWIASDNRKIRVLSAGSNRASDFYPALENDCRNPDESGFQAIESVAPDAPDELCGLSVTVDHRLIVGTLQPAGLLIFDLFATGEPRRILWRGDIAFAPFDIAPRNGGGAFVLDRGNQRFWTLDRNFNLIADKDQALSTEKPEAFQPLDNASERRAAEMVLSADLIENFAVNLDSLGDPIAIEALPNGTVLILDCNPNQKFSTVHAFRGAEKIGESSLRAILPLVEAKDRAAFKLAGFDFAFVAGDENNQIADRLYVASAEGNQTFAFNLIRETDDSARFKLKPVHEFFPMRLFGGKGLVAVGNQVFYDYGERWLNLIAQKRPRFAAQGEIVTKEFDGKEPDCVWHRVLLDACLPPETDVRIFSRAANEKTDLPLADWQLEPTLYLRGNGAELPFLKSSATDREQKNGTWESLLQNARGRWLQLKFAVRGNEQKSPRLSALRVYYPRFSYLDNYLPAVYREDRQSASFLARFFANFEGFYTQIEDRIVHAETLFDARGAPAEALDWLAGWFGVALDPGWSEAKQRLFIGHAMDFFRWRGTLRGLRAALRLALDECVDERIFDNPNNHSVEHIRISESFLTRPIIARVEAPESPQNDQPRVVADAERWQPAHGAEALNQRFAAFLRAQAADDNEKRELERETFEFPASLDSGDEDFALWRQFSLATLNFVLSDAGANEKSRWQNFSRVRFASDIDALNQSHNTIYNDFDEIRLPNGSETNQVFKQDWLDFLETTAQTSRRRKIWQNFLARRYDDINRLNTVYRTRWQSFDRIAAVDRLPLTNSALFDWFQFESIVLRMHDRAHQFTVAIGLPLDVRADSESQRRRLELVRRIVDLEKPAHTVFDVRFYWNLFRVGEARTGADTLLGLGGFDPLLAPDLKLGETTIGATRAADSLPEKIGSRRIVGQKWL